MFLDLFIETLRPLLRSKSKSILFVQSTAKSIRYPPKIRPNVNFREPRYGWFRQLLRVTYTIFFGDWVDLRVYRQKFRKSIIFLFTPACEFHSLSPHDLS